MRIGVFGGTFDPIHNGHIRIAELAYSRLRLDKLLFVPNAIPPHKPDVYTIPDERFEMVKEALEQNQPVPDWDEVFWGENNIVMEYFPTLVHILY